MSTTTQIQIHVTPAQGVTKDDVLAAVLLSQHERSLVEVKDVRRSSFGDVFVGLSYDLPAHYAETRDAVERIQNLTGIGSVAVFTN